MTEKLLQHILQLFCGTKINICVTSSMLWCGEVFESLVTALLFLSVR